MINNKKPDSISEYLDVGISIRIDAQTNQLLSDAATTSSRTKRSEATIRLKDHLQRFPAISKVGSVEGD